MPPKTESGLSDHRIEFVREGVDDEANPVTPDNPEYLTYSNTIRSFEWDGSANHEAQRGLGNVDPNNWFTGPEEHELSLTYDLNQWFVDEQGDPVDAVADGVLRDAGGYLPNTHTLLHRENKSQIATSNTVAGAAPRDTRLYTVAQGGAVSEVEITGDPGDQQPLSVELSYQFEKVKSYQIDQPNEATELTIVSDNANDTMDVTIESEDGEESETLTLDGTTDVTGIEQFEDIDAVWIHDRPEGVITVSDGTDDLARFYGSDHYENVGGYEQGVPLLGSGSHADPLPNEYEMFLGDTFTYDGGPLAMDINSFSMSVDNDTELTTREDDVAQRIHHGTRTIEVEATVIGERESHESIMRTLRNEGGDIEWNMERGTMTVLDARLTEPGSRSYEAEAAVMELDNTFSGVGLEISNLTV